MLERIGRYRIDKELGRGGFGHVYLGYDAAVNRPVAIKILNPGSDPSLLTRFQTEAAAAANLRHKNIIVVYDFGDDHGTSYLVMEYVNGRTLKEIIAGDTPLSLVEKVRIMTGAAEGLLCAHQNGIAHRDIKPANIMVSRDGT